MTETPPVHVPHHGGNGLTGSLGNKLGPLPVWVWGLIGGLAFGAVYYIHKKKTDAAAQAAVNTGSAFTTLGAASNGGNAGELATTGGGGGTGIGGAAGTSLAQWAANATNWLIGQGTSPADASNALSAYINGATLTPNQTTLVNQALANFGVPPSGILPVNTATPTPTPTPATTPVPAPVAPAPAPAAPAATAGRTYVVQPGDTYWGLAQRFYGNGNLYTKIQGANPYPARSIPVGATLTIPA